MLDHCPILTKIGAYSFTKSISQDKGQLSLHLHIAHQIWSLMGFKWGQNLACFLN